MSENYSTKISHAPDWMTSGLVRAGSFAEQEPDQPMFNTGVTMAQLKDQIKAMLSRSGLDLTVREIGSGAHWLTQRVANNISKDDTKETLMQYVNSFVAQYIVDKSVQRATGVSERSPIYDRTWYDKNFMPPTDREAAADKEKAPENGAEVIDMVYVGLDGDDMGHLVEDSLLSDDPEIAAKISNSIHDAHRAIRKLVAAAGGRLIFDGGDNILVYMPNDPEVFDAIQETHKRITKHSATIGVGHRPIEAHYALVVGKNTGKDKIVIYNDKVKAQHETIHQEQKQIEETEKKLKYRASAEELNVADRLRQVLHANGADASDKSVKELFWRIIQKFALDSIDAIDLFFSAADDADLASAAKETYAKRMDWSLRAAEAKELPDIEAKALLHDLARAVEAVEEIGPKFKSLVDAVDSQELRDLDEGMERAWARANVVCAQLAEFVEGKESLRYSHYVDEAKKVIAEITSMAIPVDGEVMTAMKAIGNAEDADNSSIDLSHLCKVFGAWVERVAVLAMCIDMIAVVSGARPMEAVAADPSSEPVHFPGQSNVPNGHGQKSPHKMHNWLTIEDYNKDKVDWSKTDLNYVSTNVPKDSDIPVGGAGGGDPIYVP